MDLHQNARLTFRSREALAKKMIDRLTLNAAAAAFNVSRKTAAKWWARYRIPWGRPACGNLGTDGTFTGFSSHETNPHLPGVSHRLLWPASLLWRQRTQHVLLQPGHELLRTQRTSRVRTLPQRRRLCLRIPSARNPCHSVSVQRLAHGSVSNMAFVLAASRSVPVRSTIPIAQPPRPSLPAPGSTPHNATPPTNALHPADRNRIGPATHARSPLAAHSNTSRTGHAPASMPAPVRPEHGEPRSDARGSTSGSNPAIPTYVALSIAAVMPDK